MKATATAPETGFWAGWHRPRGSRAWRRVCEGLSWEECWGILLRMTEGGEMIVRPTPLGNPDQPRRPGRSDRQRLLWEEAR